MSFVADAAAFVAAHPLPAGAIAALAAGSVAYLLLLAASLVPVVAAAAAAPKPGARNPRLSVAAGSWAVVTGASDGIGREFALQLAARGFSVAVIARSKDKLDAVAAAAIAAAPQGVKIDALAIPFDFACADDAKYAALKTQLDRLDIGVLVNNVAISHAFPVPFMEESERIVRDIVEVDAVAQLRITRIVLPQMLARRAGTILNIGSMAGKVPSAYIAAYSAAKAFLRAWSLALAMETRQAGVHVEHVNTFFVATAMSKIRRTSFFTPSPRDYVAAVLASAGKSISSTPYPAHAILDWMIDRFLSESLMVPTSASMHLDIRKRALRKLERESKKSN